MITAFDYLLATKPIDPGKVCVLTGDEEFLKHEVQQKLAEGGVVDSLAGPQVAWRDVHDALTTRSLFEETSPLVAIDDADKFVTEYRDKLEEWVEQGRPQRLLLLSVKSWTKTTRLAKHVEAKGLAIDCGIPSRGAEVAKFNRDLAKWLTWRATKVHNVQVESGAVERLMNLLPTSPGMLDLELAKLSLLATDGRITLPLIDAHVGDWRTRQAWDMIDLMAAGRAAEALRQLDKLLAAGEEPIALLAQIASSLRKHATAARLIEQWEQAGRRADLPAAVKQAGALPFKVNETVEQLKAIGRIRARMLPRWLLDIDVASKDYHSAKPLQRLELERLILRLSSHARP